RRPHLAVAVAVPAGGHAGSGLGAGALAGLAGDECGHLDLDGPAGKGLFERDLEIVPEVRAAQPRLPAAPAAGPAHEVAENVLENVGHRGREFGPEALRPAPPAALEGGVAEAVIGSALLGILQR